jgi:hypothetical protein
MLEHRTQMLCNAGVASLSSRARAIGQYSRTTPSNPNFYVVTGDDVACCQVEMFLVLIFGRIRV